MFARLFIPEDEGMATRRDHAFSTTQQDYRCCRKASPMVFAVQNIKGLSADA